MSVLPDCMMPDGAEPCRAYQQQTARTNRWERRAQEIEKIALKAFTVVEWVVGEGKVLPDPHFDADDLLLEMAHILGVEDSRDACARLGQPVFALPPACRACGTDYGWTGNQWLARRTCQPAP